MKTASVGVGLILVLVLALAFCTQVFSVEPAKPSDTETRVAALEKKVAALESQVTGLQQAMQLRQMWFPGQVIFAEQKPEQPKAIPTPHAPHP